MSNKTQKDADDVDIEELAEVTIDVEKEGQLSWKGQKAWHTYWFLLGNQQLYFKKREKDPEVKGIVKLAGAKVEKVENKRENCFEIRNGDEVTLLAAETPELLSDWIDAVRKSSQSVEVTKKKQSRFMALKKNIAGKAVTSSAGKSKIRDMVGPEGVTIITQVKELIRLHEGKKKATEVENNILKIGIKVILLFQNNYITAQELAKPRDLVKTLWSNVLDMLEISFCYDVKQLQASITKLEEEFEKILKPCLSEKSIVALRETMQYLRQETLLNKLYTSNECEKMRPEIEKTLRILWDRVYGSPAPHK